MLTVAQVRAKTGLSRAAVAKALCSSIRSVIKWELGQGKPDRARQRLLYNLSRRKGLHRPESPTRTYDPIKMRYYLGKPGSKWKQMSGQQKGSFYAHRARYTKLQNDLQSGLGHGQPIVRLENAWEQPSPPIRPKR